MKVFIVSFFQQETGLTASLGVGTTSTQAYLSLQIAKSMGGGRVAIWDQAAAGDELREAQWVPLRPDQESLGSAE